MMILTSGWIGSRTSAKPSGLGGPSSSGGASMEATSEPDLDGARLAGWSGDGPDGGQTLGLGSDTASSECVGPLIRHKALGGPCCRFAALPPKDLAY